MYYNDNGELKQIYAKVSDTLPIGSIVKYDGDTVPSGWQQIGTEDTYKIIKKISQQVAIPGTYDDICPVGKIEIFFDNKDHSNYLGFTWERIAQGKTLIGIDSEDEDFNTIGETGGEKTHNHALTNAYAKLTDNGAGTLRLNATSGRNWQSTSEMTGLSSATYITRDQTYGVNLGGNTNNTSSLQPYLVVAYWKRIS